MLGGLDAIARYQKAIYYPLQEPVGAALTRSRRPCTALQSTGPRSLPARPEPSLGPTATDRQTDSSRSAARREGRASSLVSRKAMVGLEYDMAQWKRNTNIKFFLIHPPSCSPLEQNSSVVARGLLKGRTRTGKGGLPLPLSTNTPTQLRSDHISCSHPV